MINSFSKRFSSILLNNKSIETHNKTDFLDSFFKYFPFKSRHSIVSIPDGNLTSFLPVPQIITHSEVVSAYKNLLTAISSNDFNLINDICVDNLAKKLIYNLNCLNAYNTAEFSNFNYCLQEIKLKNRQLIVNVTNVENFVFVGCFPENRLDTKLSTLQVTDNFLIG